MKPVYGLLLLAVFLTSNSNPSSAAVNQADYAQPIHAQYASNYLSDTTGQRSLTFLPEIFSIFRPNCQGMPEELLSLFGPSLIAYYPLWETSGKTVIDLSPYNRPGVYEGYPALNITPALCGSAPRFDGVDDVADVFSAGLASTFNGDEGTIIIQLKVEPEQWTDEKTTYYLGLRANSSNKIEFYKSAKNQLEFAYTSGGTRRSSTINDIATSRWVTYAITWSQSSDRFSGYVAGEAIYPAQTGLRAWSGDLTSAEIAGYLGTSDYFARSSISSVIFMDREASADEVRQYSATFGARKVLTVLGDSISRVYMSTPWSMRTIFEYEGGNKMTLKSHAVSGQSIMEYMDAQTLAAADDNADIIIIALGTVDDNWGDMNALQTEVEENIAELKVSNPHAILYYMNVLPIWTDKSGAREVDKSNIRAAIADACVSQGITCWDTYSTPWITAADTSDGVHPTADGQAKIADQVLLRLQSPANDFSISFP